MRALAALLAVGALPLSAAAAGSPPPPRSVMMWLIDSNRAGPKIPDSPQIWKERIANVAAHRENLTAVSPCIYGITARGGFGGQSAQRSVVPYVPQYAALGLDVVPLIAGPPALGGLAALLKSPDGFIADAVGAALKNNYSGYNFDNELRGGPDPKSWSGLTKYAAGWIAFLDKLAGALHAHGKTLSVDIAGCCGWVDTEHPEAPAGHCAGAFASHEFVATTCAQYKASQLDIVYGMSTYTGNLNGPPIADPRDNTTYDAVQLTKTIANATQTGIGKSKYAIGFKGGWPYCSNGSLPETCVFDDTAKQTIRYVRDTLGVRHSASWVDEPRSQAAWDAWGYFLHGDSDDQAALPAAATLGSGSGSGSGSARIGVADGAVLDRPATNHSLIRAVNADPQQSWRAGVNKRFEGATLRDVSRLCGTHPEAPSPPPPPFDPAAEAATIAALPAEFDWRKQPLAAKCPSFSEVRDQAGCGSCWAFGSAESMSDRLCIASEGAVSVSLSAQDIAACACPPPPPGQPRCGSGCGGGELGQAWDFYLESGVVDGGLHGDTST